MDKEFLIGTTENDELIFCNVRLKDNNEFSASFSTVTPSILEEELITSNIEMFVDNIDSDYFLELLKKYDCKPSDLVETLYEDSYNVIEDFFDNSLYPEVFNFGETEVFFESCGCGQHDTRGVVKDIFIDKEFFDYIHHLWDTNHLKVVSEIDMEKLKSYLETSLIEDEYEFIENWLLSIFPELKHINNI